MRVLTILVQFGNEQYPRAEAEIDEIFRRQLPDINRRVVVVDNARPSGTAERSDRRAVIGGDNSVFEFSGFDAALAHVGQEIWSYDLIHFATSAFNTLYVAYLERFTPALLPLLAGRPVCCGHIDCYNEPVEALGFRLQHWIRSCFFFLPPTEARALGSFVSVRTGRRFFSGDARAPFRPDAPISPNYRRYITDWLTGGDIGQGVEWHSHFSLKEDTLAAFERKALCILNEQLLAVRLQALACQLVDVTWLATAAQGRAGAAFPERTSWQRQLAGRDRDALAVPVA